MEYKAFVDEALEKFKSLPEETDELYKRYFVAMPLQEMADKISVARLGEKPEELIKSNGDALRRKFDAIFWSGGEAIGDSAKYIAVRPIENSNLENRMTKSGDDKLAAFLNAYSKKVIQIDIPKGAEAKINLMFINTTSPLPIQIIVNVAENASLQMFEYYSSSATERSLLGSMHEVKVGKYANAEINVLHNEDKNTFVVGWSKAKIEEKSNLKINFIYNGGTFTRSRNKVDVAGLEANGEVNELIVSAGEQKMDVASNIINSAKSSHAVLESKAVMMDKSVCVLKGYASITENAAESRSYVNERGIILDKDAHIDSIPSMSIGNSDVKATHSSATAPIDGESIFYLMSRGASELEAKKMVVSGFITGMIGKIDDYIVREIVASIINEKVTTRNYGFVPKITTESMWLAGSVQRSSSIFKGHYKYRGE
ncbi:MAG: SufD family Fe-S cluster assembly protein [Candidatus Micrarchaeota archaeon]|nr:SufD family Fe-S cluster assembly protein [Candidatus Micrarchaeota archaeon]